MKKKISFAVIFFICGIVLAATISLSAFREAYRSRAIEKQIEDLKSEAASVQKENNALAQQIAYFQTPEFQEKVAKEKLNLQKPDENVVVVKPNLAAASQKDENPEQVEQFHEQIPNYQKWWNFFFKY